MWQTLVSSLPSSCKRVVNDGASKASAAPSTSPSLALTCSDCGVEDQGSLSRGLDAEKNIEKWQSAVTHESSDSESIHKTS